MATNEIHEERAKSAENGNLPVEEDRRGFTETLAIIFVLSGFYCLMTVVVGFVLPVSSMLNGSDTSEHYIVVFYCVMVTLGVVCLIAIWIILACCTGKTKNRVRTKSKHGMSPVTDQPMAVYYKKDGASVFVFVGAIIFGAGFLLYQIVKLAADCRMSHDLEHYVTDSFTLVLLLIQTAVLCYYNKACINIHKGWVTFALCHLISVNMCVWVMIIVYGIAEEIAKVAHEQSEKGINGEKDGCEPTVSYREVVGHVSDRASENISANDALKEIGSLASVRNGTACDWSNTLLQTVSPYLIPCVIEYTLITVAILYSMLTSVGRKVHLEKIRKWEGVRTKKTPVVVAVVMGCLLLGAGVTGGVFAFVLQTYQGLVFHLCEVSLALVSLVAMGVSLCQMRSLGTQPLESFFDITLLLVAYAAFNIVEVFTMLPAIWQVNIHENVHDTTVGESALVRHIIEIIQGFVQVLYILFGAGRYTRTKAQATRRPGRVAIILILFANLGLWLLRVLNEDLQLNEHIWERYYGALPWTIIKSTCSPMVIFFRFHSCVCLADMVTEAYKPKRD